MIWDSWLQELMQLPNTSAEWENVEEFIESIRAIATDKVATNRNRDLLKVALQQLVDQCRDMFRRFEFAAHEEWAEGDRCPTDAIAIISDQIATLQTKLIHRREMELREFPPDALISQQAEYRNSLSAIEEEIRDLFEGINTVLGCATDPAPLPPDPPLLPPVALSPPQDGERSDEPRFNDGSEGRESQISSQGEGQRSKPAPRTEVSSPIGTPARSDSAESPSSGDSPLNRKDHHLDSSKSIAAGDGEERVAHNQTILAGSPNGGGGKEVEESVLPKLNVATSGGARAISDGAIAGQISRHLTAARTGLPALYEVAKAVQASETPENWQRLLWALVAADDIVGARWLAHWAEQAEFAPPVKSGLLDAIQSALWLSGPGDALVYDLLDLSTQNVVEGEHPFLILAATLYTAMVAPESEMVRLLNECAIPSGWDSVLKPLLEFCRNRQPLLEQSSGAGPRATATEGRSTDVVASDAKRWIADAAKLQSRYIPATKAWRLMTRVDAPLRCMIEIVAADSRAQADFVRRELRHWNTLGRINQQINKIFEGIEGRPVQRLREECQRAAKIADEWSRLIDRTQQRIQPSVDELIGQDRLAQALERLTPSFRSLFESLVAPQYDLATLVSAHCLERILLRIFSSLKLKRPFATGCSSEEESAYWVDPDDQSLAASLGRRLWWLPEAPRTLDGELDESDPVALMRCLRDSVAEGRTLETAFQAWARKGDFRFVRHILGEKRQSDGIRDLLDCYEDQLERARSGLAAKIREASDLVEKSFHEGVIEEERAAFLSSIESVDIGAVQNFASVDGALTEMLLDLNSRRKSEIERLNSQWRTTLLPRLLQLNLKAEERDQVQRFVEGAYDRGDLQILDECVAELAEMLFGESVEERIRAIGWYKRQAESASSLETFLRVADGLHATLELDTLAVSKLADRLQREDAALSQCGLETPNKEEVRGQVATAFHRWSELKSKGRNESDLKNWVGPLMSYLGFRFVSGVPQSVTQNSELRGIDWRLVRCTYVTSPEIARPIFQYGARPDNSQDAVTFQQVLCVWQRPGPDRLAEILSEIHLGPRPFLIFYLGARSERERLGHAILARRKRLEVAILDENLLVFLGAETDVRLRAFLRCSLPFSGLVPYTPNRRGWVAEEMFFGRDELVDALWSENGPSIIYGGRQLGKSSIQLRVKEKFHLPDRHHFAWYEVLDSIFEPPKLNFDEVWQVLVTRMNASGARIKSRVRDQVVEDIAKAFSDDPLLEVRFLLDQSDDFLDADANHGFTEVRKLRSLMDRTGRRFKVIFAGNRHVQRFQSIRDNPMMQFGVSRLIGPMEPVDARKLVEQPMEVLGYRFDFNSTVLQLLCYTNYHPVCIHQFCETLLRRLRTTAESESMPQVITRKDVEEIYRDATVRGVIRDIFLSTLTLEDDYLAVVLAMIRNQLPTPNSFGKTFTAEELMDLSATVWPSGFGEMELGEFQLRLAELVGLGILVCDFDSKYHLRSPNMVRLISSDGTIATHLALLSKKTRPVKIDIEACHAPLVSNSRKFSPLTYVQEKVLNQDRTGVALIFGSEPLGLDDIPAVLAKLLPRDLPEGIMSDFREVPRSVSTPAQLRGWLTNYLREHEKYRHLIIHHRVRASHVKSCIETALEICKKNYSDQRILRIHLILDAPALWTWLSLPFNTRFELRNRADAVVELRKWAVTGLMRRLEQSDYPMITESVGREVLRATGGWHTLIEHSLSSVTRVNYPAFAAKTKNSIVDSTSALRATFCESVGISSAEAPRALVELLRECGGSLQMEYVSPDLLSDRGLDSAALCETAIEFLQKIGCIELDGDTLRLDGVIAELVEPLKPGAASLSA